MAGKTANVTARIQPEIKENAEAILEKLGIPASVFIGKLNLMIRKWLRMCLQNYERGFSVGRCLRSKDYETSTGANS